MPDFNKFTNYSQELLNSAGAIMQSHKNSEMQPEHIMLAMIKDSGAIKDYLTELKLLNQGFIDKIVSVIQNKKFSVQKKVDTLISMAIDAGGYDNCTVIVIENEEN